MARFSAGKTVSRLLLSAAVLAGLAACSAAPIEASPFARHPIMVKESVSRLEVRAASGGRLASQDLVAIQAFASEYRAAGHGPLIISYPSAGGRRQGSSAGVTRTRMALHQAGLPWEAIVDGGYQGGDDQPIVLSFKRYYAAGPDCGRDWPNLSTSYANRPKANFGCALNAGLAQMIADPFDLLAPRAMGVGDTERRLQTLEAYRRGEATGTARSENEKGTVAEVATGGG